MEKMSVGILGATGMVGQKFIELLDNHPWFEITALAASDRSIGKKYGDCVDWHSPSALDQKIARMPLLACTPELPCRLVFSALESSIARKVETDFAESGYVVVSNSSAHRMGESIPLLIPEVNASHFQLLDSQSFGKGKIITNPNCSVIGLSIALKPLVELFGLESVQVVTLQSLSGAGFPGVASLEILDNVVPHIAGEEEKVETEPLKIFGSCRDGQIEPARFKMSAQCNRVPVSDGHVGCATVKLQTHATAEEIIQAWNHFNYLPNAHLLPSAPEKVLLYHEDPRFPQPKKHRHLGNGMTVSVGKLKYNLAFDTWSFVVLSHNTVRGAAGCALLNAELYCLLHATDKKTSV